MRVLFSFPFAIGGPGIGTTAYEQVRGVAAAGVEVTLYCGSVARPLPDSVTVVETMAIGGRRVPHKAIGVRNGLRQHDWRVARRLAREPQGFDVVHCWPRACVKTLRTARKLGVRSLREAPSPHTATAMQDAAAAARSVGVALPRRHSHRFDRRLLQRELTEFDLADGILVPSDYVKATFVDRGFAPTRLVRHSYGFDPDRFSPPATERARSDQFTAIFVGRGEPNKGLHLALRAWMDSGAAEHGRFMICGRILPDYEAFLEPLLAHPSVEELGWTPDVADRLRESDVLLLPSVTEGSALVTFEAQACGCVLLVSEAAGADVTHLRHGMVHAPGDVATLAEHLRLLSRDRETLTRLRAEVLMRREQLTWAAAGERLAGIYRAHVPNLANPRAQPSPGGAP